MELEYRRCTRKVRRKDAGYDILLNGKRVGEYYLDNQMQAIRIAGKYPATLKPVCRFAFNVAQAKEIAESIWLQSQPPRS